jgi:hypothetical protein
LVCHLLPLCSHVPGNVPGSSMKCNSPSSHVLLKTLAHFFWALALQNPPRKST